MNTKKCTLLLAIVSIFCLSALQSRESPAYITNQMEVDGHLNHVKTQVELRWKAFAKNKTFLAFQPGKSDDELRAEFSAIRETREAIWKKPEYKVAKHLIKAKRVRHDGCVAFAYNNTVGDFNASTLFIGNRPYIACEGPKYKHLESFFSLLHTLKSTHIVRLTDAAEGDKIKCHAYWKKHVVRAADGKKHLHAPTKTGIHKVHAFDIAEWKDNQGIDPKRLLDVALQVKKELEATNGRLTVHCSAGVGRTGTFLAALAIIDAIDANEPFSICEIVYRLSLQRIFSVSTPTQYITLHRMAEIYTPEKNRN